jgi:hypothetical protein
MEKHFLITMFELYVKTVCIRIYVIFNILLFIVIMNALIKSLNKKYFFEGANFRKINDSDPIFTQAYMLKTSF